LENSLPDIFNHMIGMIGSLCIILIMDIRVFGICLAGIGMTVVIFKLSETRMFRLNRGQNDEFDQQVEILESGAPGRLNTYLGNITKWNIRLSDLETISFSLTWGVLSAVLLATVLVVASPGQGGGNVSGGHILTMVMYVFGFMRKHTYLSSLLPADGQAGGNRPASGLTQSS